MKLIALSLAFCLLTGRTFAQDPMAPDAADPAPEYAAAPEPVDAAAPEPVDAAAPAPVGAAAPEPVDAAAPGPVDAAAPASVEAAAPASVDAAAPESADAAAPAPVDAAQPVDAYPDEVYSKMTFEDIAAALKKGEIIPNILPEFKPSTKFDVTYVNRPMKFGTEYFPYKNETDELPTFEYTAEPDSFYTIALIDPDAPSRADPFRAQVRHWLNVNIPGTNVAAGNSTGTSYLAPRPFPGCGRKRFVYVLAKQTGNMPELAVPAARPNFNMAQFVANNTMTIVGANYFEVEATPGATCTIPGTDPSLSAYPDDGYPTAPVDQEYPASPAVDPTIPVDQEYPTSPAVDPANGGGDVVTVPGKTVIVTETTTLTTCEAQPTMSY